MAKFCIYCGKPIDEKTKFCPFCGKGATTEQPVAVQSAVSPTSASTLPAEPAPAQVPSPQPTPTSAPATGHTNWLLIGSIAVIVAVLVLVVLLVLRDMDTKDQPQSTHAQDTQSQWPDIPGFSQDDVEGVAYTLLPECELLSYGRVYYNEDEQSVFLYDCRLKAPEDSLLDLTDATVDIRVDLSDPDINMCSFSGFDGTLKLKTGDYFTIYDDGGNEIEVSFEAQPYVVSGGYAIQFPNVFVADLTWMDIRGISDPAMSLDMSFDIAGDDSPFAYALSTEDDAYTIFLDTSFRPVAYTSTNYS